MCSLTPFRKWQNGANLGLESVIFSSGNEAISCPIQIAVNCLFDSDRRPFLDSARSPPLRPMGARLDPLTAAQKELATEAQVDANRLRKLQLAGILSGFAAGAWLGAAEAPTKLVNIGIPPVIISLLMVAGVFLARWTLPALIRG